MLVALKNPSVGGMAIALFSWLAVPIALVGEATIVLGKPVWWLLPPAIIVWALVMVAVMAATHRQTPQQRSYLSDDDTTIFRIRQKRDNRREPDQGSTFIVDNFCRSLRAPKGGALQLIESLHPQLAEAVDARDAATEITAAHPALAKRYRQIDPLLESRGIAGAAAPFSWLRARGRRLRKSRRALWSDVCDLLVSAVRAGMSLPDALAALAVSGPPALRPAFARFADDMAASGHFDSSALRLKAGLADPVADRILETLRMARQVGGTELTSVLRALSASVRADATLRAEVEARQSWVRGAAVVGVVAPWIVLGLLALRPEGAAAYSSGAGVVVVLVGAAVSVLAYRLTIRLGRLPESQRWFG